MKVIGKMTKTVLAAAAGLLMIAALWAASFDVQAQGGEAATQSGQMMVTQQRIDAKGEPDDGAETVFSYDAGATIFVTGQTDNGWYIVYYQGQMGYIDSAEAEDELTPVEIDVETLNAQLEQEEAIGKMVVEETERYRAEARRSKIWGAVIILLVAGIFGMGIFSTIRTEKGKQAPAGAEKLSGDKPETKKQDIIKTKTETQKNQEQITQNIADEDIWDLDQE